MNKYLLFMLATQCCCSCMCMEKSTYEKFETNIHDFASKRHELKAYKQLLGMLDYTLQDTLIQLSECGETPQQKTIRKQNRNYLKHGEEIAKTVQHFANESAAKYKENPYKWLPLTNERGICHAVGKHGILVDPKSKNITIHNAIDIYKYIQNHNELKTIHDRMFNLEESENIRCYITHMLEYCVIIHAIKNSEGYIKHTYKHDIAAETVKSEIPEYDGDKVRVDCTGLSFLVKDLDYNDRSDIYALFIPVHHAYSVKPGYNLMASVASIYPMRNCTELWFKLNPKIDSKRNDRFIIPTYTQLPNGFLMSLPFDMPQSTAQPNLEEKAKSAKKSTKKSKTAMVVTKPVDDLYLALTTDTSPQQYYTKYKETGTPGEISLYGRIYKSPFVLKLNKIIARECVLRGSRQILNLLKLSDETKPQHKYLTNFASRLQNIYDANIDDEELYSQIAFITDSIDYTGINNPINAIIQISARYGFIRLYAEVFLDDINDGFFNDIQCADKIIEIGWKDVNDMIATKSDEFNKKYKEAKNTSYNSMKTHDTFYAVLSGKKDNSVTESINNFQAYCKRHSTLLASLKQELPMLVHSATIIGGIQSYEDAWENIKLLKPVYQSTYTRLEQAKLEYNSSLNIQIMKNIKQQYNDEFTDKLFDDTYIREIDTSLMFLLLFMTMIIDSQEYNAETKNALNNISKYAAQLYENHIGHLVQYIK